MKKFFFTVDQRKIKSDMGLIAKPIPRPGSDYTLLVGAPFAVMVSLNTLKIFLEPSYFQNQEFVTNFLAGGLAGFSTGYMIGPSEALKVELQKNSSKAFSKILTIDLFRKLYRMSTPFGVSFATVCATEFSVNEYVREKYGSVAGITASALTGGALLTPTDHMMLRSENGQNVMDTLKSITKPGYRFLWTGFSGTLTREAFFISSVMYLGPRLGSKLESNFRDDLSVTDQHQVKWNLIGRCATGAVMSLASQPFDVVSREMQKSIQSQPESKPKISKAIANVSFKQLYRGALPRMGLSCVGGALVGMLFDQIKDDLLGKNTDHQEDSARTYSLK